LSNRIELREHGKRTETAWAPNEGKPTRT